MKIKNNQKEQSASDKVLLAKLKELLEEKSDDWIVDNILPRHIRGWTRTIIRRSDENWKHLRTKVKYVWYCWPMMIRNFCIDYKKNWWKFNEEIEEWLIYRSLWYNDLD